MEHCPAGLWPYFADTPALINSTSNQQIRPVRRPCCLVHNRNPDLTASAQCMQLQPSGVAFTVIQHQVRLHKLHAPAEALVLNDCEGHSIFSRRASQQDQLPVQAGAVVTLPSKAAAPCSLCHSLRAGPCSLPSLL